MAKPDKQTNDIPELEGYKKLSDNELVALKGRLEFELKHTSVKTTTKGINAVNAVFTGIASGFSTFAAVLGVANFKQINPRWFTQLWNKARIETPIVDNTPSAVPPASAPKLSIGKEYLFEDASGHATEAKYKVFAIVTGVAAGVIAAYTSFKKDNSIARVKDENVRTDELKFVNRIIAERQTSPDPIAAAMAMGNEAARAL